MVEIRMILADLGMEILSQKEAGIQADVVEDGSTFEENAMIKATEIAKIARQMPEYADAYSYAQLANEARLSRGKDPIYSDVAMELIRTGMDQDLYPNVNWRDVILKDHVWQNQHFLSKIYLRENCSKNYFFGPFSFCL